MPLVVKDRVQVTSTTTGTGTYTLSTTVTGFQAFSVIGDGNKTYYTATDGVNWEVGIGTYTASGTTLSRDAILESSNAGSAVNWGAGTRNIFVVWPADAASLNWASTATAAGTTVLTNQSAYFQFFTGTSTQTITLPVVSTLAEGWTYHITNNSTGNLTVNSSGGNLVITVIPGTTAMVTCILTTGTTAASWEAGYTDFSTITGTGSAVLATSPTITNLSLAAGTTALAPLDLASGTNLTVPIAGAVEYDGTIITATSNTNFGRGTIPITNYASGTGVTLGTNSEATPANLLPAANDTITLPIGTYFLDTAFIITRGASTTSATARLNIRGGSGTAVGTFSGMSVSSPTSGGATANFSFNAVSINTANVLTAASTTSGGVYQLTLRGIMKITTSGTIIPQYSLSANINGAGTVATTYYFRLQQLDTQSAAAFGPAGTGWA